MSGRAMQRLLTTGARNLTTASPAVAVEDPTPTMPEFDYTPPHWDGHISKEEVMRLRKEYVNPAQMRQTFFKDPPLFVAGKMQYLYDDQGKRYLDLFGGICTVSAGHAHPQVNAAIEDQISRVTHTSNVFLHPKLAEYAEYMVKKLNPEKSGLSKVFFCNSGSEANDLAILMARAYTGNLNIVGLRKAYHGASVATMPLTAMPLYRVPNMPITNVSQTMSPDVYRGIWGGNKCRAGPCQALRNCDCEMGTCKAGDNYAAQYEDHLLTLCPSGRGLAAFIGEGMGGMTASLQAPKNFYKQAFEITKKYGGVNILDEVQTAFGRLGSHYWGFEYHGVKPDIITCAKSIGNGMPIGMCATTPEIAEAFADSGLHFNTFGGNAVASAAGLATLKAIDDDGLMENSHIVGNRFLEGFNMLREKYDHVGDCRGKGLFMSLEMVESQSTHKPIPNYHVNAMCERLKEMGVVIGKGGFHLNCFRIQPPMCITLEDADFVIACIDQVFSEYRAGTLEMESFNPNK